eukprot:g4266.t1
MRLFSKAIGKAEQQLVDRNRDILLAAGAENLERTIEREFVRVNKVVSRDLANYPALHRQISDTIEKIENDFQHSTDSPPLPPAWLDAVESIAAIPRNGDPAVTKILKNIHQTVESAYAETQKEFQKATLQRHKLLGGMQPMWRSLAESLNKVKGKIDGLDERSEHIDRHMDTYAKMRAGDQDIMRVLASSSLTQFFISGLVLVIAALGGLINFQLIAMPMSEMVGGTSYIGSLKTSDIAALVIILIEIAMGLFLMESLRITRLFPIIGSMDDRMRRRMMIVTFCILTILATIEASLAYMRDLLALDREALAQSLAGAGIAGGGVTEAEFRWIPSIGQMIMGFVLPFALAFVAIPLESFIHSTRTVLGMVFVAVLRSIAVLASQELNKAQLIMNYLLATLDSGDSIAIARIDNGSFSEKDIIAMATFDDRPSTVNSQKRVFKAQLDTFVEELERGSTHTDISGGLLQATAYLEETGAGEKHVLIFSDLEEDLVKGHIREFDLPLDNILVSALNVTKLRSDNVDPREYLERVAQWESKVTDGGGEWRVINDLERLDNLIAQR